MRDYYRVALPYQWTDTQGASWGAGVRQIAVDPQAGRCPVGRTTCGHVSGWDTN